MVVIIAWLGRESSCELIYLGSNELQNHHSWPSHFDLAKRALGPWFNDALRYLDFSESLDADMPMLSQGHHVRSILEKPMIRNSVMIAATCRNDMQHESGSCEPLFFVFVWTNLTPRKTRAHSVSG